MKVLLVVVLYKESISSSKTLSSLCSNCLEYINDFRIVVWDNSPFSVGEDELNVLKKLNIEFVYHHTPENISLAKIYNSSLQLYCKDKDVLFLFDQDSYISADYFIQMKIFIENTNNSDIDLFVPYIQVKDQVVSPGKMGFYNGRYLKEKIVGRVNSRNMIAITSGMAIRTSLFRLHDIMFDENLSLYGIDTEFCLEYAKVKPYLFIIDYQLIHSLSIFEKEDIKTKIYRFKNERYALLYSLNKRSKIRYLTSFIIYIIKYNILLFLKIFK